MRITAKKWALLFILGCVLSISALIVVNYVLNRNGYFSSLPYGQSTTFNGDFVLRNAKASYIRQNPQKFTGFIIGGSRTMVLEPEIISKYTGRSASK